MEKFEPIFLLDDHKLIVLVMAPNACYMQQNNYQGVPDDVTHPNDGNYHHTIILQDKSLTSVSAGEVSFSMVCMLVPNYLHVIELNYAADSDGKDLTVYVGTMESNGKTKERKRKKVERTVRKTI